MKKKTNDVIIIGAGPAGMACALQLCRYGIRPLVFEKNEAGGLLRNANLIENYLGFPDGITGSELVRLFKEQVKNISLKIRREEVISVKFNKRLFSVQTKEKAYESYYLVLASGSVPKKLVNLNFPSEAENKILYDIVSIMNCENKNIVIIGAGDLAFDFALNLGKKNSVVILNRSAEVKCIPLLLERVRKQNHIKYFENTVINEVTIENCNMYIEYKSGNSIGKLRADYLIPAIGRELNNKLLFNGFNKISGELEQKGLFYKIGDVKNINYRQTSIAAGDGIKAAMKIYGLIKRD
jgi:thioredoxin reductase (NADPH)